MPTALFPRLPFPVGRSTGFFVFVPQSTERRHRSPHHNWFVSLKHSAQLRSTSLKSRAAYTETFLPRYYQASSAQTRNYNLTAISTRPNTMTSDALFPLSSTLLDIHHAWPYLGLIFPTLFILRRGIRPRSLPWLSQLTFPLWALHQFEEHGIDCRGRRYAFLLFFRAHAAHVSPGINKVWVTGLNIGLVWLWGLQVTYWGAREPLYALGFAGLMAVHAAAHLVPVLLGAEGYNPGLLSAMSTFPLLSWWLFRRYVRERRVSRRQAWGCLLNGVVLHVVNMVCVQLIQLGWLSTAWVAALYYVLGSAGPYVLKTVLTL